MYDWVGSLSTIPDQFVLSTHAQELDPSLPILSVHRAMLYMIETEASPKFPEEDVQFLGYGLPSCDDNDTLLDSRNSVLDCTIETPSIQVPDTLLEEDTFRLNVTKN